MKVNEKEAGVGPLFKKIWAIFCNERCLARCKNKLEIGFTNDQLLLFWLRMKSRFLRCPSNMHIIVKLTPVADVIKLFLEEI